MDIRLYQCAFQALLSERNGLQFPEPNLKTLGNNTGTSEIQNDELSLVSEMQLLKQSSLIKK